MTLTQTLQQLKAAGTAQTRKTYARHGVGPNMFGVSYATLGKLTRAIQRDHALALGLWASGNHDARVLATMVGRQLVLLFVARLLGRHLLGCQLCQEEG